GAPPRPFCARRSAPPCDVPPCGPAFRTTFRSRARPSQRVQVPAPTRIALRSIRATIRHDATSCGRLAMRLCRFAEDRIGLVLGEEVHDATAALAALPGHRY